MSYDDSAAPYVPGTPSYDTSSHAAPSASPRGPRRGPLSARLAARATPMPAPASVPGDEAADTSTLPSAPSETSASSQYAPGGAPAAQTGPAWDMFTTILREPGGAAEALHDTPNFGVRWNSRADMLGACLDEYYRLTTRYNDARMLLKDIEQDLAPLRQQQMSALQAVRALEERLELHSRVELRTAYLRLAEVEMRIFRVEQERDQLSSRAETLEGFMGFLSRIISTIRTIPAEALEQPSLQTDAEQTPQGAASSGVEATEEDPDSFEELVIDADEAAALAARGDVEVIGAVEEIDEAPAQTTASDALPTASILDHPTN